MKTRKLMAVKPHRYGTRHLVAGDEYEAPARHAMALVAARRARFVADKPAKPRPIAEAAADFVSRRAEPEPQTDHETTNHAIDRLRLEATQLGINIDGRWGVARLQHEIAQRRG